MSIGETIRKERKRLGLTQKRLGEKCGMPDSQIRQYESGRVTPKVETLRRISEALEIPFYALTGSYLIEDFFSTSPESSYAKCGQAALDDTAKGILDSLPSIVGAGYKVLKDSEEALLLTCFSKLNMDGKTEALKRIEELTELKKYTAPDKTIPKQKSEK